MEERRTAQLRTCDCAAQSVYHHSGGNPPTLESAVVRIDGILSAIPKMTKLLVTESQAVQVLLDHPGSTSSTLSREAGWSSDIWLKRFGALLKKREAGLWPIDADAQNDDALYAGLVADRSEDDLWTMRTDVAEAFAKLGVVARSSSPA